MRRHIQRIRRPLLVLAGLALIFLAIRYMERFRAVREKAVEEIPSERQVEMVKFFPFTEEGALKEWEEKVFKGRVTYNIEKGEDLSYVRATSNNAASALYYRIKLDAKAREPVISWKWRVEQFPEKVYQENLDKENEDDFAARVYVIFPAMFLTNSKVLEYVWAEHLSAGTTGTSPYSKNIKLIVLRSGLDKDNRWVSEERDINADYMMMFGGKPEYDIGAIAFMTNTEHTGSSANAVYDDIEVGYKDRGMKGGDGGENKILKNKVSDR